MPITYLKIIQRLCLIVSFIFVLTPNLANYYLVDDRRLQWAIVLRSIAWIMFLLMVYVWINESIKKNKLTTIISGWAALYLSINLGVVMLGYNLYTRGVIEIFVITTLAAISHLGVRLWQKY